MQIKKGFNKLVDRVEKMNIYIIFAIILFVQIVFMLYYCNMKQGFFVDEIWSYGLSNSYYHAQIWEDNGLDNVKIDPEMFKSYLTVNKGEEFSYGSVIYNQTHDTHPPLFYLILHTISSFFPGQFSKWFGLIPNVFYFAISMFLLLEIARCISKNNIFNIAVLTFYGFSIGAVNSVTFVRMYMLLTMWCLMFLLQNIRLYQEKGQSLKNMILLSIATCGGMYTQFFFIIFVAPIVLFYMVYLLKNKQWKYMIQYCICGCVGAVCAIALFPSYILKVFGGDSNNNSSATHENLKNIRDLGKKVSVYWGYISAELFGSILIVLIIVVVTLLIIGVLRKLFFNTCIVEEQGKRYLKIEKKKEIQYKIELKKEYIITISIMLSIAFYFIIVSKITQFYSNRYIMCIYPLLVLCVCVLIYAVLKMYIKCGGKRVIIFGICVIFIVGLTYYANDPCYLYPDKGENSQTIDRYCDNPCVYIYYSSYRLLNNALDLEKFDDIYQVYYADLDKKIDEIDTSSPEMILYVDKLINAWGGKDLEACIKESTKILGYTDYEKIAEDNDSMTFCLSK